MTPHREIFWHIPEEGLFYFCAAAASLLFLFGFFKHLMIWKQGMGVEGKNGLVSRRGLSRLFFDGVLGARIFKGDPAAGVMHMLIMWGFLVLFFGTIALAVDHYLFAFLYGDLYKLYSVCLETAGLMLVIGLAWALIRRYFLRVERLERRFSDFIFPAWLLVIGLSGFIVEGARLAVLNPAWADWSFFGGFIGKLWPNSYDPGAFYPFLWWSHALLSLGFIAVIPYTKFFHVMAAPAGIYLHACGKASAPWEMQEKGEGVFTLRDRVFLDACTGCGRCVEKCPSTRAGEPFAPRDFIVGTRAQLYRKYGLPNIPAVSGPDPESREKNGWANNSMQVWHCTTCRACLEVCPVYVSTPEIIQEARGGVVEEGTEVPVPVVQSLERLYKYENPWEASKKRTGWTEGLDVVDITRSKDPVDLCYWVGCTTSFDTRARELARSFSMILAKAGVSFGILGKKETCCGDIARRVGEKGLFEEQMQGTMELFSRYGVKNVVTSSPHCFHTLRWEYPWPGFLTGNGKDEEFKVFHYTQIVRTLIASGALKFKKAMEVDVTYHDPCYLGRYNRIFDTPREILKSIPGVRLIEMAHNREDSLCCGGGGGRMWQEDLDSDPKMSEIRVMEAESSGAGTVITACPLCLIMLEDARKTAGLENSLRVMDMNEFVVMALGLDEDPGES